MCPHDNVTTCLVKQACLAGHQFWQAIGKQHAMLPYNSYTSTKDKKNDSNLVTRPGKMSSINHHTRAQPTWYQQHTLKEYHSQKSEFSPNDV
jgi:hypothetical protein